MKILLVKTSSMGDVIHALPVAADIAARWPDAQIDWVCEESFADIPRLSPFVGTIEKTAFRRWRKTPLAGSVRSEVRAIRQSLRARRYDMVIDLQGLMRSAWAASWCHAPVAGFTWNTVKEPLASLFYSRKFALPATMPAVTRCRQLAAQALGYTVQDSVRFDLRPESAQPQPPFSALLVNTSRQTKLWPQERWIRIGRELASRGLPPVFYWGSPAERGRVESIASSIEGARIEDRRPLREIASRLRQATVAVGVDTGLTHLSAALSVPTVGIFCDYPVERVGLMGDAPVRSLGGVGQCPSFEEVWKACLEVNPCRSE